MANAMILLGAGASGDSVDAVGAVRTFDGPASGTYVPNYTGTVRVELWGCGADGTVGDSGDDGVNGDGGAGGCYQGGTFNAVADVSSFAYAIPATPGSSGTVDTTITLNGASHMNCPSGNGLDHNTPVTNDGAGPVNRTGGDGEHGWTGSGNPANGGGGGSSGTSSGDGVGGKNGDSAISPGLGGKLGLPGNAGDGGSGEITGVRTAENGVAPGGGGSGSVGSHQFGLGANGRVQFTRLT